ncbi:hypothetical protein BMF94_6369 [Rhodotorula taiwanensis]|uniref:UBA domain-containing protein n=1 Tax=Rhodotorula taiwanensis TaxID=741276 RepID=A0A2S5B1N3_9BASI|nr:hypothetical protein BMF94_6369 [Rhodotorula taiwanensis]
MTADAAGLQSLISLGIPRPRAAFALKEYGGDVEAAADWCFTEGAEWTPQSLLNTTPMPAPAARRSPSLDRGFRAGGRTSDHPPGWRAVPHRLLTPGTPVSITLKQDQGTGRTVEGTVSERLTKGDHPRGVKVRLEDGRVGRVVSILR